MFACFKLQMHVADECVSLLLDSIVETHRDADVTQLSGESKMVVVRGPPTMTHKYQPVDSWIGKELKKEKQPGLPAVHLKNVNI